MHQDAIVAKALLSHCEGVNPRTLLDLGAGDGTFCLRVARRLAPYWKAVTITLLDRESIVSEETRENFRALGWNTEVLATDVLAFLDRPREWAVDCITANLFLHHFHSEQLARLLELAATNTRFFVAFEPRRAPLALLASRMLWVIGCNEVTRHDAVASVRAGFHGNELSNLWPKTGEWLLHEQQGWLFTHCFAACRRGHQREL